MPSSQAGSPRATGWQRRREYRKASEGIVNRDIIPPIQTKACEDTTDNIFKRHRAARSDDHFWDNSSRNIRTRLHRKQMRATQHIFSLLFFSAGRWATVTIVSRLEPIKAGWIVDQDLATRLRVADPRRKQIEQMHGVDRKIRGEIRFRATVGRR